MNQLKPLLAAVLLSLAGASQAANVLVVLSDADHLELKDGKTFSTGFYLNELAQPLKLLLDAGHEVTFATPAGKAPTVDASSLDPMYFQGEVATLKQYQALVDKLDMTSRERSPVISLARVEQIGYAHYDALYIPGGHAPMQDLIRSAELGRLLTHFHQGGKPTALVCHGPAALLSALNNPVSAIARMEQGSRATPPGWIYAGYRMTVISNQEEGLAKAALKGGTMKLLPQTGLEQAGASYSSNSAPWMPYVVTDRELITGQNPASALQVGQALLERLKK
ncbi:type 1 glutamine amidotransferase domain-containing protein [Massilia antarctica]|uniref:type 1 glutamine amidotransferase domain-containing protein n=1 Tax=Massilia antarctica TaxID=2765360 RepID=UPI0006BB7938|nr:type 1 glutamine amidotransferase domain-containing protein [Massilia sp. H27-R4]MCY0910085.1 type 1 glutamine amidotransferase domain-containing protein [Massilia sp. H27-R4]CUI02827.1 ThiJ/PfpI family protein [Janthinobacterium sp. CG23_2]CUU26613.1 ThiJ/PfpI family protein [Janthinobacterium sp. CG23_2]